eukprot:COSAG06_NODE_988_length_11185_cov_2.942089_4_plen_114_part_00
MPGIPAAALSDDVLVRYEHPQLLSKKEVRGAALAYVSPAPQRNGSIFRPPIFRDRNNWRSRHGGVRTGAGREVVGGPSLTGLRALGRRLTRHGRGWRDAAQGPRRMIGRRRGV